MPTRASKECIHTQKEKEQSRAKPSNSGDANSQGDPSIQIQSSSPDWLRIYTIVHLLTCPSSTSQQPTSHHSTPLHTSHPRAPSQELRHHSNHQIKQPNSLHERKTQNRIREKLSTERRVTSGSIDQSSEDETDSHARAREPDSCAAHTEVLTDFDHGLGDFGGVGATVGLGEAEGEW